MNARSLLMALVVAAAVAGCASERVPEQANGGIDRGGNGGIDRGGNGGIDRGGNGGVDRGGVSRGTITGFGSVIVNGIRFDTSDATIEIDGETSAESELQVGYVVTVTGVIDSDTGTGDAEFVAHDAAVSGPVDRVDAAAGELRVLGQRVLIRRATRVADALGGVDLEHVEAGTVVRVSGYALGTGTVVATRIDPARATEFELSGQVEALDPVAMSFAINSQLVDFSAATLANFPPAGLQPGQYVRVVGTIDGAEGRFRASAVGLRNSAQLPAFEGDEVELEGVITRFASTADFDVSGQPVTTDADTRIDDRTGSALAVGAVVEVEGELDDAGVLLADEVSFRPDALFTLAGRVEAVGAGTLTLLGTTLAVGKHTIFEDDSGRRDRFLNLDGISTGDYVEVRAYQDTAGLVAVAIERDDDQDEIGVEGFVDLVQENEVTIFGIVFQMTPETKLQGRDGSELPLEAFVALLSDGAFASAEGTLIGDRVAVASSIELEYEDD